MLERRTPGSLLLSAMLLCAGACAVAQAEEQPRNVVLIIADDLGWMDISPNNPDTFYETPNLERLARSGTRFTDAYAACPVCSPTRGSIMTGKYPARTDTTEYFCGRRQAILKPASYQCQMPLEEVTIAEALKDAGYATFFAGKWHLGPEGFWPEDQGFDVNRGGWQKGGPYGGKKYFSPYGNPRLEDGPAGEHLPDRLARETVDFMRQNREQPFMAVLSFYSVHTPLMAPKPLVEKYTRKRQGLEPVETRWKPERERLVRQVQDHPVYAAMVESMDSAVGTVLNGLDELGLAENTIVVFFSDNGGLSTSEGHPTSNLPLRAGKGWMYEGGIREPCLVRVPGMTPPGSTCEAAITSTDFYPTFLELCGEPLRPDQHMDGISLVPMLQDPQSPDTRKAIYWHYPHYGNQGGAPCSAIRMGDWKLIEWFEDESIELFNLAEDPGETRERSSEEPERAASMRAALLSWREDVGANLPRPNPDHDPASAIRHHEQANRSAVQGKWR